MTILRRLKCQWFHLGCPLQTITAPTVELKPTAMDGTDIVGRLKKD